jgi:hypothetical protein
MDLQDMRIYAHNYTHNVGVALRGYPADMVATMHNFNKKGQPRGVAPTTKTICVSPKQNGDSK